MRRRRGYVLFHVLVVVICFATAAAAFAGAFGELQADASRGPARARARAVAEAAWGRARVALAAGRDPAHPEQAVLGERASVARKALGGGAHEMVVQAVVSRGSDTVACELRLVVHVGAGHVTVLERREVTR